MKRWLRHHQYACTVAVRRLRRHPLSTLANVVVIALMLSVPILGAAVLQSSQPLVQQLAVAPQLTVFLDDGLAADAQAQLQARLHDSAPELVRHTERLPRAQAMAQLRSDPTWAQAFDALPFNPLPDAIVVTLQDSAEAAHQAPALAQQWDALPGVDRVQLDGEWVHRLEALLSLIKLGVAWLAGAVALVVLATVFNTVRLQALTQREEIAVARLMGATETFVRRPFLYLGALTGLAASVLALVLAWLAMRPLNHLLGRFAHSYGVEWTLRLPAADDLLLATLLIVVLGAFAARLSVTRHTRA